MPVKALTPILNVSNVHASQAWFEKLGWKAGFTWPDGDADPGFGAVCIEGDGPEIFLCCGAQGSRGTIMPKTPGDDETDGVWMCWFLGSPEEVDALHQIAIDAGCIVTYPPTDELWGVREFHLRHPDGHMFRWRGVTQRALTMALPPKTPRPKFTLSPKRSISKNTGALWPHATAKNRGWR